MSNASPEETRSRVRSVIGVALDELNEQFGGNLRKDADQLIFGGPGGLDSLGLVNFMNAVEEGVAEEFGKEIVLADSFDGMSRCTIAELEHLLQARLSPGVSA